MTILALVGSLRNGSYNAAVARAAVELAPAGVDVQIYDALRELPPYDGDEDTTEAPPAVSDLRRRIRAADALLVVTPEYNGSIPGVLKNAIDWASRPHRTSALWGKTAAVAGATTGSYGAIWALADLRRVLGVAGARVIDTEVSISQAHTRVDAEGRLDDSAIRELLRQQLDALVEIAVPVPVAA